MRPFLVTALQAGKLPRWALLALCGLYVLPGFVGRDPWRSDDSAGFGIALTMAHGGAPDWLVPNIAGEAVPSAGPLPFWVGAVVIRLLPFASEYTGARAAAIAGVLLGFFALWNAVYALAHRPGLLFADPFGASASRVDFGRAIADSALLILLATLGVIAPLHETTADAAQVTLTALYLLGAAAALERPVAGGALAGAAVAGTVLTSGLLPAGALGIASCLLPLASPAYRLTVRSWLPACVAVAAAGSLAWPLALALAHGAGPAHLAAWLAWNRSQLSGLDADEALHYLRTVPWYFWPAWPIAGWALVRWRGRLSEPALALPLVVLVLSAIAAVAGADNDDRLLPQIALPVAMLAGFGLPTLRRAVVSLIDWFAVMTFSVIGFAVWAYWLALLTGFPPKMAHSATRIAPGFHPDGIVAELVLGGAATLAWVLLVRWRIARHPPVIWRAVVLSSGGLVLAWFLLMTLWLPAFNERNTYREVARQVAAKLDGRYRCVATRDLATGPRANLLYFAHVRFGAAEADCDWLLVQEVGPIAHVAQPAEPGWRLEWEGGRPRDRDERLRLLRRVR